MIKKKASLEHNFKALKSFKMLFFISETAVDAF